MPTNELRTGREYLERYTIAREAIDIIEAVNWNIDDAQYAQAQLRKLMKQAKTALEEISEALAQLPLSRGKNYVIEHYVQMMTVQEICEKEFIVQKTYYQHVNPVIEEIGKMVSRDA